ncbi:MAG: hypothetical protein U5K54_12900 [Cytophagales bacterium]|nr:hypothetical protein [Cytophagales bacterium]
MYETLIPQVWTYSIQGCKRNDRDSQRLLYQHYYSYALSICIRYSRSVTEAKEVVNGWVYESLWGN